MASHFWVVVVVVCNLHLGVTELCGANWSLQIGDSQNFTSPNYPSPYLGGTDCRWAASTPENSLVNVYCSEIDILQSKLGCCIDLFYISGWEENGRWIPICGTSSNFSISTTKFEAYFTPEYISHNFSKGFTCTVTVLENKTKDNEYTCCECGRNSHQHRIIGGDKAELHEWPWQVALFMNKNGKGLICGGSLISPDWILTAAHCIDGVSQITATLGEHEKYNDNETSKTVKHDIDMDNTIIHPGYNNKGLQGNFINDIAVLKLSNPIEYSPWISPVCLPSNMRDKTYDGENATVTGWGLTAFGGNVSNTLLEVTVPVISNTMCDSMYQLTIWDDQICTFDDDKAFCQGDSGGPLVWLDGNGRYQQIGIVSFSLKGCTSTKNNPAVYTRVSSFLDWIEEKTNIDICST